MSAADDDAFWLHEADPAVDICDPSLTVDACLDVITPEMTARVDLDHATILDLGCGIGRLTNPIHARYPDARVMGIDPNGNFLADARRAAVTTGVSPVYVCCDAQELGIITVADWGDEPRASGYDAVYSMAVFQHLDSARKRDLIAQVGLALRPGGVTVFQYVEGTHSSRCMYDALVGDVLEWCTDAGLKVQRVQHDLLMPRWTWVTATKEAAA
jgi:2-polyprenyl-3-methyl-5-hydroxy-6-metoxy-1,4-benzoquinol methylase